jgi:hypothetical protein
MAERTPDGLWQRSIGPNVYGWIKTADLAKGGDMRKVIGCWPFKQIHPASGEATFNYIDFFVDGKAILVDVYGKKWRSQVLVKDALVWVKPVSKFRSAPYGEFFRISSDSKTLEPGADNPSALANFSEELLKGCKGILTSSP